MKFLSLIRLAAPARGGARMKLHFFTGFVTALLASPVESFRTPIRYPVLYRGSPRLTPCRDRFLKSGMTPEWSFCPWLDWPPASGPAYMKLHGAVPRIGCIPCLYSRISASESWLA